MGCRTVCTALAAVLVIAIGSSSYAQRGQRGAPPPQPPPAQQRGFGRANTPTFPGPPAGMQALPIDMFTSKNFYKDKDLWSDKRYFRCNTPRQITDIWTSRRIGNNPPTSASWGDCSIDYPREKILSPYPYKTAKEHYEALLAKAKAAGGPTVYTKQTVPDWDGWYGRDGSYSRFPVDLGNHQPGSDDPVRADSRISKAHGSDELPRRRRQLAAVERVALLSGRIHALVVSGITRRKFPAHDERGPGSVHVRHRREFLAPGLIGREHVQKVPQWYGETVGFWNGTTLVTWTANVQAWTISHSMFEYSDKLETIETYAPVIQQRHVRWTRSRGCFL